MTHKSVVLLESRAGRLTLRGLGQTRSGRRRRRRISRYISWRVSPILRQGVRTGEQYVHMTRGGELREIPPYMYFCGIALRDFHS